MRLAVINGTTVENIVEADEGFAIEDRTLVEATAGAEIGGTYSGGVFTPPEPPVVPPRVPEVISRRQFYEQLEVDGIISKAEALAAMKTGTLPAALQAVVDGMTDEDAKYDAEMKLVGATDFYRSSALVMVFAIVIQWSEERVDQFWTDAEAR